MCISVLLSTLGSPATSNPRPAGLGMLPLHGTVWESGVCSKTKDVLQKVILEEIDSSYLNHELPEPFEKKRILSRDKLYFSPPASEMYR